jgi:hypothetical protein
MATRRKLCISNVQMVTSKYLRRLCNVNESIYDVSSDVTDAPEFATRRQGRLVACIASVVCGAGITQSV